jgi:hypothetical protein
MRKFGERQKSGEIFRPFYFLNVTKADFKISSLVGGTTKQSDYYQLFSDCFVVPPTNDDRRIMSPVGDGMSVENNFRGFTACRRDATCREKYTFRTCGTKRTTMRLFLPTFRTYGTKRTPMRLFLPTFRTYGTTFHPVVKPISTGDY